MTACGRGRSIGQRSRAKEKNRTFKFSQFYFRIRDGAYEVYENKHHTKISRYTVQHVHLLKYLRVTAERLCMRHPHSCMDGIYLCGMAPHGQCMFWGRSLHFVRCMPGVLKTLGWRQHFGATIQLGTAYKSSHWHKLFINFDDEPIVRHILLCTIIIHLLYSTVHFQHFGRIVQGLGHIFGYQNIVPFWCLHLISLQLIAACPKCLGGDMRGRAHAIKPQKFKLWVI